MEVHVEPDGAVSSLHSGDGAGVGVGNGYEPGGQRPSELESKEESFASDTGRQNSKEEAVSCFDDRVVGAVVGAAIGDALGHPTEFVRSWSELREKFGPEGVRGFALYWDRDERHFAPYTDDTQMAELVLRTLIWVRKEDVDLDRAMHALSKLFITWSSQPQGGHRAPGNACLEGSRRLEAGASWFEAGGARAGGCGSVMRAYPAGLVFSANPDEAQRWAVAQSKLTHRDPIALAACAAMARSTAVASGSAGAIIEAAVQGADSEDQATADMIRRARNDAATGVPKEEVLERLQGWAAHECIAAAAYCFTRHPDNFREAVLEAANTPGDSDSIATLVGAWSGAHLGLSCIPSEWVCDLERTAELQALSRELVEHPRAFTSPGRSYDSTEDCARIRSPS